MDACDGGDIRVVAQDKMVQSGGDSFGGVGGDGGGGGGPICDKGHMLQVTGDEGNSGVCVSQDSLTTATSVSVEM